VQLIKAATDSHLWADTFDRKLTESFQWRVSGQAIADQLRVKLTVRKKVIAAKPKTIPRLRCLPAWPGLYTENGQHTRQRPWRTEISQGSGAVGPEVRPCLGAAVMD